MENKYEKKKEAIRDQILRKAKYYRKKRGIQFYDRSPLPNRADYDIQNNDLEVLSIKLKKSKTILITTACIYINDKGVITRIDAGDIEKYEYLPHEHYELFAQKSVLKRAYNKYQLKRHIGDLRIKKTDGSFIDVYLSRRNLLYCLSSAIRQLQFVNRKYNVI